MKNIKTRDLIYCALFAALTAIGAFLHFQLFQATITLQFFFTAMAGLLLGAKLGALSQLLYVVLGLVGVPIFAAGGGFGYIFNPTFGFLLGLIPTAWVIGKIAEKDRSVPRLLLACFAGLAVLYLVGLPYIALIVNVYKGGNVSGMTLHGLHAALSSRRLPQDRRERDPRASHPEGHGAQFIKNSSKCCICNFYKAGKMW